MNVLDAAREQVGKPYVFGGPGGRVPGDTSGFDCSGFVSYAFAQAGISLPAYTDALADATVPVDQPAAGDLVLYRYADPYQPTVRYPHAGLMLDVATSIDASYGRGVSVHPVLGYPHEFRHVPGFSLANGVAAPQ